MPWQKGYTPSRVMRSGGHSTSSSQASLMPSHTSVGSRSRTLRAFSRARLTQATMLSGLSRPKVRNHGTLRSSARRWVTQEAVVVARDPHERLPHQAAAGAVGRVALQGRGLAHLEQAREVLGALEVARRPVERLGDPGQHQLLRTQVSLLPPPWEELTTSDPSRSATRVRPPGTTTGRSP